MKKRLTSLGLDGIGWDYVEGDKEVVRRVLGVLEGKDVLVHDAHREEYEHCRLSAQRIRDLLDLELSNVKYRGAVHRGFKIMRDAARAFIRSAGPDSANFHEDHAYFVACLEAFRAAIGHQVRWMAKEFKVDLDPRYAATLPQQDLSFVPGFE